MRAKNLFTLALVLFSAPAFAGFSDFRFDSIKLVQAGTAYVGLGQKTREQRFTGSEVAWINFRLNGEERRLWDDDGFATLFLYHRHFTAEVYSNTSSPQPGGITLDSPLPQPKAPLVKSLERLHATYSVLREEDIRSKDDPAIRKIYDDVLGRINSIKAYVNSSKFQKVRDLETSGLQALLNELVSNHTYMLEVGGDKTERNTLDELIASGTPVSVTDPIAPRCYDHPQLHWTVFAKTYEARPYAEAEGKKRSGDSGGDGGRSRKAN